MPALRLARKSDSSNHGRRGFERQENKPDFLAISEKITARFQKEGWHNYSILCSLQVLTLPVHILKFA